MSTILMSTPYGRDLWYTLGATFGVIGFITFILAGILSFIFIWIALWEWMDPEGENDEEDRKFGRNLFLSFIAGFLICVFLVVFIGVSLVGMGYWG